MTVYGETTARLYAENAKTAPNFAPCPISEADFPNREQFGTIFAWVQAEQTCTHRSKAMVWKETLRHYAIAKVITG
jgi:hypothetical protein